jgi:4-hydroxy-4-methyl-2-oxoglutarate aldolase
VRGYLASCSLESMDSEPKQTQSALERLSRLDCCAVSDALDMLKLSGVVSGLPQLAGSGPIAGRAITMKLGIGTAPSGPTRHLGTTAIEAANPGDVIVVEQKSGVEAGSWGGILALGAKLRAVAGVVADGPVRDIDEAKSFDFPVFARACTARTARGRVVELATNGPVEIGTVTVNRGDYVIADGSGVVFIKPEHIERVLRAAESIAAREAAMAQALRAGRPITEVMGAIYEHMLKE